MKVLVTGACGQLGHDVIEELNRREHEAIAADLIESAQVRLDITDEVSTLNTIRELYPDAVIHCAAWTAVDAAEDEENQAKVWDINVKGTENVAKACKAANAKMLYLSTDYVFGGQGSEPWEPDCRAYRPLKYYGQTKLEGEHAVDRFLEKYFIVRIAWAFGKNGNNFVKTMLKLADTHDSLRVVCDQIGTPTYTPDLARLLVDMIETDRYGYYHATNEGGFISWYDFAVEIFRLAGKEVTVTPVTTEEYGLSKAKRPANSRLSKSKLRGNGFTELPDWKDALRRYIESIEED